MPQGRLAGFLWLVTGLRELRDRGQRREESNRATDGHRRAVAHIREEERLNKLADRLTEMFVSFWGMRSIGMAPWVFPLSRQFEFNLCLKGGIGS